MKLSVLPWPTRREIIQLVVQESTEYSLISKEWFEQTARVHGKIVSKLAKPTEAKVREFSRHVERIWLDRVDDIDWDTLHSNKNIKKVVFNIQREYSEIELEEFNNNLVKLPYIESVKIWVHNEEDFDITRFLVWNQHHLKELVTPIEQISRCLELDEVIFSNLTSLKLERINHELDLQSIALTMPQLKKLCIEDCGLCRIVSFNISLPKLIELTFCSSNMIHRILDMDLTNLPNLKSITSFCCIEFAETNELDKIEEIVTGGPNGYLLEILSLNFINLKRLNLSLHNDNENNLFMRILHFCQTLTTLKLSTRGKFEFPKNLPVTPYTVIELSLQGSFILTAPFLHWLSDNFKLKELELMYCELGPGALSDTIPFSHLHHLEIYSRHDSKQFKDYFNKFSYPHVEIINITKVCETCSYELGSEN